MSQRAGQPLEEPGQPLEEPGQAAGLWSLAVIKGCNKSSLAATTAGPRGKSRRSFSQRSEVPCLWQVFHGLSLAGLRHNLPLQQVSSSQGPDKTQKVDWKTNKQTSVCSHTCVYMYVYMNLWVHYMCMCACSLCGKTVGRMPWLCLLHHVA